MRYMLMMHAPRAGWETAGIATWPMEDIKAHIAFRAKHGWKIETTDTGVRGNPIAKPAKAQPKAKAKPARKNGKPVGRRVTKKTENGRQSVTEPAQEQPAAEQTTEAA